MVDHNTTNSLPASTPVADRRTRSLRSRATHEIQDDVPHGATERREPRRAAVALERARIAARIADDNRGKDILLLDLRQVTPLVDFFVIITATSRRQGHAIASEVDQEMKKLGEAKLGIEGSEEGRWTLIDYGDFVVHIFSPEDRAYYALEEIWGDAPQLDWHDPAAGESARAEEAQPGPAEGPGHESES
ncbi:MAG TPA: ribosome silencing factor [Isosphaeraceae bacterium]|nr:ribosome silencing factor [Isosphaeraceae bacterium]